MIRRMLILTALTVAASSGLARADTSGPFQNDPMGPLSDVTETSHHYQPASNFCIKPDAKEYAGGGIDDTATGRDPACRRAGFSRGAKHLVKIHVKTPSLCTGCRRFFVDFSKIPPDNGQGDPYAHGHVYYHLNSMNWTYTVDPTAHSPNTKNFTNDKLIAPDGSTQEQVAGAFDLHAIAYVSDTAHFIHTKAQGPYYTGAWYLNRAGQRIHGVYLDVDVANATQYPSADMNAIGYMAGFNTDGSACPSDDDAYYAGCVDWWGMSSTTIDPFAD
jgi:hypothetical protein